MKTRPFNDITLEAMRKTEEKQFVVELEEAYKRACRRLVYQHITVSVPLWGSNSQRVFPHDESISLYLLISHVVDILNSCKIIDSEQEQ